MQPSTPQYSPVQPSIAQHSQVQPSAVHHHQYRWKYTTMYTSVHCPNSLLHRSTLVLSVFFFTKTESSNLCKSVAQLLLDKPVSENLLPTISPLLSNPKSLYKIPISKEQKLCMIALLMKTFQCYFAYFLLYGWHHGPKGIRPKGNWRWFLAKESSFG